MIKLNPPTILTLTRLILSPIILPYLLVNFLQSPSLLTHVTLVFLFILLALTDLFDGLLARRSNDKTEWGRILDPLADKFLVLSALAPLVYTERIDPYFAIIIIGREFFVMGLRELSLFHGFSLHVSWWGKAKTVSQLLTLVWLIGIPKTFLLSPESSCLFNQIERLLLQTTIALTLLSAFFYLKSFLNTSKNLT